MIWSREEYLSHMTFQYTGREMFCEMFGPLVGLEDEWKVQGASPAELDLSAFGGDSVRYLNCGCITGFMNDIEPRILEDTKEYTISLDPMGRKNKLIKGKATIQLPLDYPVKTMDDWMKVKHWYTFSEKRVDREKLKRLKRLQDEGTLILAGIPGGFDELRELMGAERLCMAYYDEPEMIKDIIDTMTQTALKALDIVTDSVTIDNLHVHEDMAGKSGPLVGPKIIEEFIKPYYKTIWDEMKRQGSTLFSQDSDGNMNPVIDVFLDAGVNVMYPFEPAAGMDMVAARRKYGGRLAVKGGINKYALLGDKADILRELEYKMCGVTKGGGTVFALDHRIPNGVPLENYRYYIEKSRELLELPPAQPEAFVRMAF